MDLVDEFDAGHRVGTVMVGVRKKNPISEEVLRMIIDRFDNVYGIGIGYYDDQIDMLVDGWLR